jgi:hypothetical protein
LGCAREVEGRVMASLLEIFRLCLPGQYLYIF